MKLFSCGRRYEDKDFHLTMGGGLHWVKWLNSGLGQCFVSCNHFCSLYLFISQVTELYTSACLNLNYGTAKK